ncbi:unnamed protein product [marine sediment metagenome]|uniref:Uncharacterized protein n=1 Tax=marine sediment metagenome TaxID=412755 RepID=X1HVP3_9ZZZZ
MEGIIDIDYKDLKEAVERIEKKIGTCKILPGARFNWKYSRVAGDHMQVGNRMPNLNASDEHSEIELECLVCSEMEGKSTGTQAEDCKNCILKGR